MPTQQEDIVFDAVHVGVILQPRSRGDKLIGLQCSGHLPDTPPWLTNNFEITQTAIGTDLIPKTRTFPLVNCHHTDDNEFVLTVSFYDESVGFRRALTLHRVGLTTGLQFHETEQDAQRFVTILRKDNSHPLGFPG